MSFNPFGDGSFDPFGSGQFQANFDDASFTFPAFEVEGDNKENKDKTVTFDVKEKNQTNAIVISESLSEDSLPSPIENNHPFRVSTENFLADFGDAATAGDSTISGQEIQRIQSVDDNFSFQNGVNFDEFSPKSNAPAKDTEGTDLDGASEHMITSFVTSETSPGEHFSPFGENANSDFEISFDDFPAEDNHSESQNNASTNKSNSSEQTTTKTPETQQQNPSTSEKQKSAPHSMENPKFDTTFPQEKAPASAQPEPEFTFSGFSGSNTDENNGNADFQFTGFSDANFTFGNFDDVKFDDFQGSNTGFGTFDEVKPESSQKSDEKPQSQGSTDQFGTFGGFEEAPSKSDSKPETQNQFGSFDSPQTSSKQGSHDAFGSFDGFNDGPAKSETKSGSNQQFASFGGFEEPQVNVTDSKSGSNHQFGSFGGFDDFKSDSKSNSNQFGSFDGFNDGPQPPKQGSQDTFSGFDTKPPKQSSTDAFTASNDATTDPFKQNSHDAFGDFGSFDSTTITPAKQGSNDAFGTFEPATTQNGSKDGFGSFDNMKFDSAAPENKSSHDMFGSFDSAPSNEQTNKSQDEFVTFKARKIKSHDMFADFGSSETTPKASIDDFSSFDNIKFEESSKHGSSEAFVTFEGFKDSPVTEEINNNNNNNNEFGNFGTFEGFKDSPKQEEANNNNNNEFGDFGTFDKVQFDEQQNKSSTGVFGTFEDSSKSEEKRESNENDSIKSNDGFGTFNEGSNNAFDNFGSFDGVKFDEQQKNSTTEETKKETEEKDEQKFGDFGNVNFDEQPKQEEFGGFAGFDNEKSPKENSEQKQENSEEKIEKKSEVEFGTFQGFDEQNNGEFQFSGFEGAEFTAFGDGTNPDFGNNAEFAPFEPAFTEEKQETQEKAPEEKKPVQSAYVNFGDFQNAPKFDSPSEPAPAFEAPPPPPQFDDSIERLEGLLEHIDENIIKLPDEKLKMPSAEEARAKLLGKRV